MSASDDSPSKPSNDDASSTVAVYEGEITTALLLASGTLLLAGIAGKARSWKSSVDRHATSKRLDHWIEELYPVCTRVVSVGGPYYAASQLGGARTGLVLLMGIASGMTKSGTRHLDYSRIKTWKRVTMERKWTCAAILVCILCDFSSYATALPTSTLLKGYTALAASLFLFPPPVPGLSSQSSTPGSGSHISATPSQSPIARVFSSLPKAASVLVASGRDSNLTLLSSLVAGCIAIATTALSGRTFDLTRSSVVWFMFTTVSGAGLYLFSRPDALRSRRKLGFAIGCLFTAAFSAHRSLDYWGTGTSSFLRGGTIGLSFFAVLLDTFPSVDMRRHTPHDHRRNHSAFTGFLLRRTENMPFLHSILEEKDSRRILYFMG